MVNVPKLGHKAVAVLAPICAQMHTQLTHSLNMSRFFKETMIATGLDGI